VAPGAWSLVGLVRACHPGPTLAVTTVTTLLATSVGRSGAGLVAIAAAVLTGQLSVGWSNDAHDAEHDLRALRADKPVVAGEVTVRTLWIGAFTALAATTVLSLVAVGLLPGALHLVAVALAWSYNLGVARTRWSFLPYAGAFALLPTVVATAAAPPRAPAPWAVIGFAAMGLGAHLVNGIRDLEVDRRVGLDGAAMRLGPRTGRLLAAVTFVVAGVAVGAGLRDARPLLSIAIPTAGVLLLVPSVWLAPPRWAFRAVLVTAVALVAVIVLVAVAGEVTLTV
jgi:4-hydroxybenzoate polyprenyltransferase